MLTLINILLTSWKLIISDILMKGPEINQYCDVETLGAREMLLAQNPAMRNTGHIALVSAKFVLI